MSHTKYYSMPLPKKEQASETKSESPNYGDSEKFIIGCRAVAGVPVTELHEQIGMSRSYIYQQKKQVMEYAASLDDPRKSGKIIELDKSLIKKAVVSLMLDCGSSTEGVQRFFEAVFGMHISIGKISSIMKDASEKVYKFDESISLEGISQGANDEIFQGNTPIFTGIDPVSTYCYLLEEASDRSAETWATYLQDRKDHGLELKTPINDGGTGLIAGTLEVYSDAKMQRDTFHASHEMGKEVARVERKAYAKINEEYDLKKRMDGRRPKQKTKEKLEEVIPETRDAIETYDVLSILFEWFKELLGFSGYNLEDTTNLIEFILQEMEKVAKDNPGIQKECEKVRKILPHLLLFIDRLEEEMRQRAEELGIPYEAFELMYRQRSFGTDSQEYQHMEYQIVMMLMERYDEIRAEFQKILSEIKKASSLVENLNGRIRRYINLKRVVPTRFFVLLKVYFNTRRYRRSRVKERVGKSPLELLTGKEQPDFYEILGFCD